MQPHTENAWDQNTCVNGGKTKNSRHTWEDNPSIYLLQNTMHDVCFPKQKQQTTRRFIRKSSNKFMKLLHYFVIISYRKVPRFLSFSWVHVEVFYGWICKGSELWRKKTKTMFIIKSLDNKQLRGIICCDMWGFEKILIIKLPLGR